MKRFLCLLIGCLVTGSAPAMERDIGGHLKLYSSATLFGNDHLMTLSGRSDPFYNHSVNFRYKLGLFLSDRLDVHLHYDARAAASDIQRAADALPPAWQRFRDGSDTEDTRVLDLEWDTGPGSPVFTHRLDRLYARYRGNTASVSIGRQAVTTGSGLIFNPMDLFNPFAPSDVIRDYKTGTDMALCQFSRGRISDGMLVWVPRRNPDKKIDMDESSFALKLKTVMADHEAGILLARHYNDDIIGFSFSGFAGAAAWRSDLMWTHPAEKNLSGYVSAVANIDYSGVLNGKNAYILVEVFYSGLGETEITSALQKQALTSRIQRGDLFLTATRYAGLQIQYETHPLVNLSLGAIVNLDDRSALLQPVVTWNAAPSLDILLGADIYTGGTHTEFTGITDPATGKNAGPGRQAYLQASWYF